MNYFSNLITKNPVISNITKTMERMLKYFSINVLIFGPKKKNNPATKKNRALLLKADARIRVTMFILQAPAAIVNTL